MFMLRFQIVLISLVFLINGCGTVPGKSPGPDRDPIISSIAVWNLENIGPDDSSHAEWGELLSSGVLQVFEASESYSIVEREQLLLALEELHLGTSALADESTRLRLGRMAGARWMVFGTYMVVGDTLRLDLRREEVETGRIAKTARRVVTPAGLTQALNAAGEAARDLI